MALSLYSGDCGSPGDARELFASEKGLLVLRPGRGCCGCSPLFTVPSGCYALVTRHGADLNYVDGSAVWPAGLHAGYPPWIGVSHLVTKQSVVLDLPVKACKTRDNVTVNVDMSLVFRIMGDADLGEDPELVRNFVYAVKPKGLEQQLRDAQEEAVRGLARSLKHTEIYGIRSGGKPDRISTVDAPEDIEEEEGNDDDSYRDPVMQGTADEDDKLNAVKNTIKGRDVAEVMRAQLNKQFISQGILIESVMIKRVDLPAEITTQMSDKTMVISQNAAQRMYHENEMQQTRMEQKVQTLMQTFADQKDLEKSDGAQKLNAERVKMNDSVSQTEKVVSNIKEATKAHIDSIRANNSLEVQRIKDKMYATTTQMNVEAEKESAELLANTRLEVQTLISDAELTATRHIASAQLSISKAEGTIAPWIAKKKAFQTDLKRNEVYDSLASNQELIVVGGDSREENKEENDIVNLVAVADSILADIADNPAAMESDARTKLVAEMAILHSSSASYMSKNEVV